MCPKRTRREFAASTGRLALGVAGVSTLTATATTVRPAGPKADYYVSTIGSDRNPGTEDRPFGTIRRTLAALSPGDLAYVRGGTYRLDGIVNLDDVHGTADAPIRLQGAPGERPVLQWQGGWSDWEPTGGLRLNNCSHWTLRNLEFRNSPYKGIDLLGGTHHVTLVDIDTHHHALPGVSISESPDNTLVRVNSHHNYDAPDGGANADGLDFNGNASKRNRLRDCRFYRNSDDGIDTYTSIGTILERCVAFENGFDYEGDAAGNGNGFKLGIGEGPSGGHRVERCVAYSNRRRGFTWNNSEIPMKVYNCTAWNHDLVGYHFGEAAHELRNNISHRSDGANMAPAVDGQYNSWNLGIERPQFRSTDPSSPAFLHLAAGSPCIDAGVSVPSITYLDASPDLGAYEYDR